MSNDTMPLWAVTLQQKQLELSKARIPVDSSIRSFEQFQEFLSALCARYESRKVTTFVQKKLVPHFDHIKSFTSAINSATQSFAYATCIWAGLQLVLECACRFAENLDNTFSLLGELHELLPHFEQYIDLYPSDDGLKESLSCLFGDYLDFCIHLAKYISRGVFVNMVRGLVSSSYRQAMKRISQNIARHREQFNMRVTLVSRRKVDQDHALILQSVALNPVAPSKPNGPVHDLPFQRNRRFFGREEVLIRLYQQFNQIRTDQEPISSVLHGMGGVGKTQVALEYSFRYRTSYHYIFWLPAEASVALRAAYCAIGRQMGIFSANDEQHLSQRQVEAVQEWLRTEEKRWLLIFDNVESWESISTFWPTTSQSDSSIIVTCQKPAELVPWAKQDVPITHLNDETGARFLLQQLGITQPSKLHEQNAHEVSQLVGGLPVLLSHIGGQISQSQSSLAEYLQDFHKSRNIWHGPSAGATWMYERTTDAIFDIALSRLSKTAKHLLYVLAFLNPDGVPESILFHANAQNESPYLQIPADQSLSNVIGELRECQLVKREHRTRDSMFTIHRSLQEGILAKLGGNTTEQEMAFACAMYKIRRLLPRPNILVHAETDKWYQMEPHIPQLLSLRRAYVRAHPRISASFDFAEMLFDVGMNMWDRGLTKDGEAVLRTAEEVLNEINYPEKTSIRAKIDVVLAVILDDRGISGRGEARERRQRAVEVREHIWKTTSSEDRTPEDEILLFAAIGDLCGSYRQINHFDEVRCYCQRLYAKYQSWGGVADIPWEYSKYYNDMSFERAYENDTGKAVMYASRAWRLMDQGDKSGLLSNQYKLTWTIRLFQDNQRVRAIAELREVLNFRVEAVGRNNYLTVQSRLVLGAMLYYQRNFRESEELLREVLQSPARECLPEESIARATYFLSLTLLAQETSDLSEIQALQTEAQEALEKFFRDSPSLDSSNDGNDPAVLYDYLVAAGLRLVIFKTAPNKTRQVQKPISRIWSQENPTLYEKEMAKSFTNLTVNKHSHSKVSLALTLP